MRSRLSLKKIHLPIKIIIGVVMLEVELGLRVRDIGIKIPRMILKNMQEGIILILMMSVHILCLQNLCHMQLPLPVNIN